jgi:hypothetical protein
MFDPILIEVRQAKAFDPVLGVAGEHLVDATLELVVINTRCQTALMTLRHQTRLAGVQPRQAAGQSSERTDQPSRYRSRQHRNETPQQNG